MLTKISATTGALSAVVNVLNIFGILNWSADQIAVVNVAVVAVGTLIHTWFNPNAPFLGKSNGSTPPAK